MVCFIAGPLRAETRREVRCNIRRATTVACLVVERGWVPLCPHTMTPALAARNDTPRFDDDAWVDMTRALLARCDALVLVPGWERSPGARLELADATRLGLELFIAIPDLTAIRPYVERHDGGGA